MARKDNENQLKALEALARTGNVLQPRKKKGQEEGSPSGTGKEPAAAPAAKRGRKKKEEGTTVKTAGEERSAGAVAGEEAPVTETRVSPAAPGKPSAKKEGVRKCHASFLLKQEICDEIEKQASAGLKENTKTAFVETGTEVILKLPPEVYFRLKTEAYSEGIGFTDYLASVLEKAAAGNGKE